MPVLRHVLLLLLVVVPANGGETDEFWLTGKLPDRQVRRALATQFLTQIAKLDNSLPTLSPSQEAWIKREVTDQLGASGNRYTKRALAAMDSLEYDLFIAKPRVQRAKSKLVALSSSNHLNKETEIALWSEVAALFCDHDLWQAVESLVERKVIDRDALKPESVYLYANYALKTQRILERIISPYLRRELP